MNGGTNEALYGIGILLPQAMWDMYFIGAAPICQCNNQSIEERRKK